MALTDRAVRVDEARGIRETARFIGDEDDRIYTSLHEPAEGARAAVLMCPSLHAEMSSNYRREVLLARRLAGSGVAAMRFHYRGTGHSDRDSGFETIESMRADAEDVLRQLLDSAPSVPMGAMGTRLGAALAVDLMSATEAPLVLWEPVLDGARYLRETLRKRAFREIAIGKATPTSSTDLQAELREQGVVDVLGYPISTGFHDSVQQLRGRDRLHESRPRPLLLLEIGRGTEPRQEYGRLIEELKGSGWDASASVAVGNEAWWFAGEGWESEEDEPLTKALLHATTSWFERHLIAEPTR